MPDNCNPLTDPLGCAADAIGGAVGSAAGSAIDKFVEKIGEGINKLFELLATAWFEVPSPDVDSSTVVRALSGDLRWITLYIATLGVLLALGRMAWELRAMPGLAAVRMIVNLVAVSALGATVVAILVDAGDHFAPWVVSRATGEPFNSQVLTTLMNPAILRQNVAIGIVIGLLAMLATLAQVVFMVVRGAMLIILVALLPTLAAGSATEEGMTRFKKMLGLLMAFVIYKPVAAIVYAAGLRLLHAQGEDPLMDLLYGLTIVILAAFALPAVIRFIVPAAGAGSSSIFSGGAMAAAGVASGAAVVSLGGGAVMAGAGAGGAGSLAAGRAGSAAGSAPGAASAVPSAGGSSSPGTAAAPGSNGSPSSGEGAGTAPKSGATSSSGGSGGEGAAPARSGFGSAAPSGGGGSGAKVGHLAAEAARGSGQAVPAENDEGPHGSPVGGK